MCIDSKRGRSNDSTGMSVAKCASAAAQKQQRASTDCTCVRKMLGLLRGASNYAYNRIWQSNQEHEATHIAMTPQTILACNRTCQQHVVSSATGRNTSFWQLMREGKHTTSYRSPKLSLSNAAADMAVTLDDKQRRRGHIKPQAI